VVHLGPDGGERWRRQFAGEGPMGNIDQAHALARAADGSVYLAGVFRNPVTSGDLFVIKLSAAGDELWRHVYKGPGPSFDRAQVLVLDADANPVVGGEADRDWLVRKLAAASGDPLWSTTVNGLQPNGVNNVRAAALDPATGDVLVAGSLENPGTSWDFAVVRLAGATGAEIWRQTFNGNANDVDIGTAVAADATGNVFAAGWRRSLESDDDAFVVKLAPDKAVLWSHAVHSPVQGRDRAQGMALDPQGHPIVVGHLGQLPFGRDFLVLKLDAAAGSELWRHVIDGGTRFSADEGAAVLVDAQGGVAAAGTTENPGSRLDMTVIRLSPEGVDAACLKNTAEDPDCRPCSAGCNDGEPCTVDACDGTDACVWTAAVGDESATCGFARSLAPPECTGARVPRGVRKRFKRAGTLVTRGLEAASARRAAQLLGRGSRLLGRVLTLIDRAERRRRRPLPAPCASALRALVGDTRARVEARRAT
jgi:hypothetical protein